MAMSSKTLLFRFSGSCHRHKLLADGVSNTGRLVVHPTAKSICQYLASSYHMAPAKRHQQVINVQRSHKSYKITLKVMLPYHKAQ